MVCCYLQYRFFIMPYFIWKSEILLFPIITKRVIFTIKLYFNLFSTLFKEFLKYFYCIKSLLFAQSYFARSFTVC